jgi:5-(aminomethyl)-3-furanmethanol phosphate kinase
MPLKHPSATLTVVKLGGSLASKPQRSAWLDTLVNWGGPLLLVPGGGPFADCVRKAQSAMGFDDVTAHRLALIAMGQYGIALAAYSGAFALAKTLDDIELALARGKIPVWLPEKMALAAPDVPASWEVTSDSLAAWLAGLLGARRLLLLKSLDLTAPSPAGMLAAEKIVDPAFPRFAAKAKALVWLAGPASLAGAAAILQRGVMPGTIVTLPSDGLRIDKMVEARPAPGAGRQI